MARPALQTDPLNDATKALLSAWRGGGKAQAAHTARLASHDLGEVHDTFIRSVRTAARAEQPQCSGMH